MSLSYLREELRSLALITFGYLIAMVLADPAGRIVVTMFGVWLCYLVSIVLFPDLSILFKAVWEARDFYYLPEACEFVTFYSKGFAKEHPQFEPWLRCAGIRLSLGPWRTYRHYTSPHFLLLYIVGLIFIYLIIKYTRRLLNTLLDNEPPVPDDLPAPPGGYHMFTHSEMEHVQARVDDLTRRLEAAQQTVREVRAGAAMSHIMLRAVHRREASTLRNQYRAEKRRIWELKSPTSSSKHSPGTFLLTSPAQGTARANRLQNELDAANSIINGLKITASQEIAKANVLQHELDAANSKIKGLEIAASSPKASRKLTVKFATPLVTNAAEAAEIAKLKAELEEARTEIEALKSTAPSSNTTSKNCDLNDDENKRLSERLHRVEEELVSTQQELQSTKEKATEEVGKVKEELKAANLQLASSRAVNKRAEDRFSIMCVNADKIYNNTLKELDDVKSALATAQAAAIQDQQSMQQLKELDDVKSALATAQAAAIQDQQSMQQLRGHLESLQSQLQAATTARDQFRQQLEAATTAHDQIRQQLDQCLASDPNELQAKLAAAENCIAVLQKENDIKEADIVENLMDYEDKKLTFEEMLEKKDEELAQMRDQLVELRLKFNAEESKTVRLQKDLELQRNKPVDQPVDLESLRSHPEMVKLKKRYFTIQDELANAKQDVMIAQFATQEAKNNVQYQQEELAKQKKKLSAEGDRIIDLMESLNVVRKGLAEKTGELAAVKKMAEEQGEMISRLQNIDDLF